MRRISWGWDGNPETYGLKQLLRSITDLIGGYADVTL
jgi:hypothetical protein